MKALLLLLFNLTVISITVTAQITSTPFPSLKAQVCSGETITFNFTTSGDSRSNDNKFFIKLFRTSNAPSGSTVTENTFSDNLVAEQSAETGAYISGSGSSFTRLAVYKIGSSVPEGKYKLLVFANNGLADKSSYSNEFTINALATAVISDAEPGGVTVVFGQTAAVLFTFGGTGPWSFSYNDLEHGIVPINNETINPAHGYVKPTSDYLFDASKLTLSNVCGLGTVTGSALIKVKKISINTSSVNSSTICPGRDPITVSFTPEATPPSGSTYKVELSNINGTFDSGITEIGSGSASPIVCNATTMASISPGTNYRIRVVPTNNAQALQTGNSIGIALNRSALPTVTAIEYCQNSPLPLQATGTSLYWYGIKRDGTEITPQNSATTPTSPTQTGSYEFQVTQTVSGCQSALAVLKVTVKARSATPPAIAKDFCRDDPTQALTTTVPNAIWYDNNNQQLTTGANGPSPNTSGASPQYFKYTQDNNGCRSDFATVTVQLKDRPGLPSVTSPPVACQFGPVSPLTATGQNLRWYRNDDSFIGESAPTPSLTSTSSQTYKVSQTVNGCESAKATITQTFRAAPTRPVVETGKTFCVGQQNIQPLTATGQNLKWYQNNNPLPGAPVPLTDQARTIDYQVSQNDGCESERSTFTIRVLPAPGVPTVTAIGLCQGVTSSSLTATGESLKWYEDATTTTALPGSPVPSTTQTGTRSYFVTQTVGNCEGPRAELKVTINPLPVAPTATPPNAVCETINSPQIVGPFTASGQNLTWYGVGLSSAGSSQPPSSATASPGTFTVAVTQTVLNCPSPRLVISQTINPAPVKPAVSPLLLCLNDASKALSATALSGHRLNWYGQSATGGTASTTVPIISAEAKKDLTYYVSQTNETTSCESPRQSLTVTVANKPNAPEVIIAQFACLGTPAKALVAKGNDLLWMASSGGGLTSPTLPPTPPTTTAATYSYTVVDRLGSCTSDPSVITFTVRPLPAAPAAQPTQNACVGSPFSLSATGNALKWYSSQSDADNKLNSRPQVSIPTSGASSQTWYVTQSDGNGCESPYVPVLARVLSQATARLVGDGDMYSTDSSAIRIYLGGEGPWTLTFWDGEKNRTFTRTQENPLVVWVRLPKLTTISTSLPLSFSLGSLSNDCGAGVLPAPYQLRINPVTAIDPGNEGVAVSAYPNPTSGFIRVDWSAAPRKAVTLRIISIVGSMLWQTDRIGTGTLQTEYVNTSLWPGGSYILQFQSVGVRMTEQRIIKQ